MRLGAGLRGLWPVGPLGHVTVGVALMDVGLISLCLCPMANDKSQCQYICSVFVLRWPTPVRFV